MKHIVGYHNISVINTCRWALRVFFCIASLNMLNDRWRLLLASESCALNAASCTAWNMEYSLLNDGGTGVSCDSSHISSSLTGCAGKQMHKLCKSSRYRMLERKRCPHHPPFGTIVLCLHGRYPLEILREEDRFHLHAAGVPQSGAPAPQFHAL